MSQAPAVLSVAGKRSLTRRGVLWLGLRCDVRCKFCYDERVSKADKLWITLDDARAALNKFRHFYQNEYVDFMGGEPTLHPRVLEIVAHSASIGLKPTLITHAMHLAKMERAKAFKDAGVNDFLVSIHGVGDKVAEIHGRNIDNFNKQLQALDNLRSLGVPVRFNCTLIRDNLTQLGAIVDLASEYGASVINFLTFNPYFEWSKSPEIEFQAKHSEIAPYLAAAILKCDQLGIEANVRYMPICQMPGNESHVYTGFQLPYDTHEWDYNSWYDMGHPGQPSPEWYLKASQLQQQRHHYLHVSACGSCALKHVCDGFHKQYLARWGGDEARPYEFTSRTDPTHFIVQQAKFEHDNTAPVPRGSVDLSLGGSLSAITQFDPAGENRAGIRVGLPTTRRA